MTAALKAARRGHRGANPLVGAAILTKDAQVVVGHHAGAGSPHAEVDAITTAIDLDVDLAASTLFVTLEPCAHTGRTGPCTQAIIDAGIPDVVFALHDSNGVAAGGGTVLAEAGVRVRSGLGHDEASALNVRWRRSVDAERPFVTAKIAQSLDGMVAASDGTSQWITSAASRDHAHELRSRVDGILVGTGTALTDDPRLNARGPGGEPLESQPVPIVLGLTSLPPESFLALNPDTVHLRTHDITAALGELHARGMRHILIEGGPGVLGAFFAAGAVDEVFCYQAPLLVGPGRSSLSGLSTSTLSEAVSLVPDETAEPAMSRHGPDVLLHFVVGESCAEAAASGAETAAAETDGVSTNIETTDAYFI
ncbi:bifunctional diaminohydroxyphosphoribosylaminopyrimidine deaminase/5-amino-6-(5-phosphoribosylamino)uracil reductase RibD [Brevibacterium marinum]|uniref:Riboflavin biosynthesis protein RibD n=1 Tax=Brevibacterium marinum TaxID=418643 RepID=A0A846RXZ4_9MICO|nr:bifunctional diaminohydroxyphosphoribosylaminopyrimidine deaminase/5-amino-6-(5-phosphoribosylamino)uracil reductase RibD [Brevibacterium marinum]NJC56000.1 diaminohydroxyphosphoribosylaminopyrimidine deaminase/5-amino-6-(5-phosphoribosylamino)uracil reductase [Brevibacterium marinum]